MERLPSSSTLPVCAVHRKGGQWLAMALATPLHALRPLHARLSQGNVPHSNEAAFPSSLLPCCFPSRLSSSPALIHQRLGRQALREAEFSASRRRRRKNLHWIGSKERLEGGVRTVRESSQVTSASWIRSGDAQIQLAGLHADLPMSGERTRNQSRHRWFRPRGSS